MLAKPPSKLRPSLGIAPHRVRSRTPSQQRSSSQTPTIRKKFSPIVNKSFLCYKDQALTKHQRALSLDKTKEISASFKHAKTKSLRNSGKILIQAKEPLPLEYAKTEMLNGNYKKSIEILNKILKAERDLEAVYSRGVCHMHIDQNELAVKDFLIVLELDPLFDKQLYIALYMCYIRLNQHTIALRCLSKGLRKFPNFLQGYLLRGQVYNKAKKYEKALQDFKRVLNIDKQQVSVMIHIGESYIGLNNAEAALRVLSVAASHTEMKQKAYVLKVSAFYELGRYDEALSACEKVTRNWPEEISVYFYKGLISFKQKKYPEASLCFEQVTQGHVDAELCQKSLFYLTTIKIRERDFYGALHILERSLDQGQSSDLKALHKYTESVISLMKRKLEEGVKLLNDIIASDEISLKEYIGSCYEYRGFAHFSLKNYESAFKDFKKAEAIGEIERATEFNDVLCKAVISAQREENEALEMFEKSKEMFPRNIMPDLCMSCIYLQWSHKKGIEYIEKAESLVEEILRSREPESEVLFFMSIIKFCMKQYEPALDSSKKAIEKADENIAVHYIHRGFCNIALKQYEEAIQDLTIAIQLNENFKYVYIYRGISAFLQDDIQLASDDFSTVLTRFSNDETTIISISKLLMVIGSYTESLEQLTSLTIPKQVLLCKNYLLLNDYSEALKAVQHANESELVIDKEIIKFFLKAKKNSDVIYKSFTLCDKLKRSVGQIFTKKYTLWVLGVILLYNKEYSAAIGYFQTVLEILHDDEPEVFADTITIEEENCEILYNLALCSLLNPSDESKANALMIFEELSEVLNEKHRGQLLFLCAILLIIQKNKPKAEKLLKEAVKSDPETLSPFLDNESITVLPLHTSNETSEIFPLIPIQVESLPSVFVRPAMVLPHPEIEYQLDDLLEVLKSFFNISTITPRPEAPWLLRVKGSIQFTDAFIEVSQDLETEIEEKQEKLKPHTQEEAIHAKSQNIFRSRSFLSEDSKINLRETGFDQKIKNLCKA